MDPLWIWHVILYGWYNVLDVLYKYWYPSSNISGTTSNKECKVFIVLICHQYEDFQISLHYPLLLFTITPSQYSMSFLSDDCNVQLIYLKLRFRIEKLILNVCYFCNAWLYFNSVAQLTIILQLLTFYHS